MTTNRIPSLDGLRALSVLLVVLYHLHPRHTFPYEGVLGVEMFFVISGYLITKLLQDEHEKTGRISLSAFYKRRAFRIFPAAFAYIAVIALLGPEARNGIWYALTYTMSYNSAHPILLAHLWSLSVEEQFYFLWSLALVIGYRYRGRIALGAVLVAAIFRLVCSIVHPAAVSDCLHAWFPGVMDGIASGCLLAVYEPRAKKVYSAIHVPAWTPPLLFVSTIAFAAFMWDGTFGQLSHARLSFAWGLVPLLLSVFLFLCVQRAGRVLNNRVAVAIGALSYSLYLWHVPFTAEWAPLPVRLFLMVVFACLSYILVEKPTIELGRRVRWPYGPTAKAPICVGAVRDAAT